jgi:PAS domain S-box-containing protein
MTSADDVAHQREHDQLISEIAAHFEPVLDDSPDGVYLWLDQHNIICNDQLAKLLGYATAEECSAEFSLESMVATQPERERFIQLYEEHVANLTRPATFHFTAKRKDGSIFQAETDMIPFTYAGHTVAYHFVRAVLQN